MKRIISLVLSIMMVMTALPMSALAEGITDPDLSAVVEETAPTPTAEPTATPTAEPTATSEPSPTETSVPSVNPEVTVTPAPTMTPEPTEEPTPTPSATPEFGMSFAAVEGDIVASGTCGANGDNLTWSLTTDGVLTISGEGEMADYGSSDTPWYINRSDIQSVVIENGVTSIGFYAFFECISLTSIAIPDSVTSIGSSAFYGCSSLSNVTIPEGVTHISDYVFNGCVGLESISFPDSLQNIGVWSFADCSKLKSINLSDNMTIIGEEAFKACSSLESIDLPDSLLTIGERAFFDCIKLTNIDIPESTTTIGWYAFAGCSNLQNITIPSSVISIGNGAFESCKNITHIVIPDGVSSINYSTFSWCSGLTSISIPDSVISVGDFAFQFCNNLRDVYYSGTEAQWTAIPIGTENKCLLNASIHYLTSAPSATTSPSPTPTVTPIPEFSATPEPTATPSVSVTPEVTITPEVTEEPTLTPVSGTCGANGDNLTWSLTTDGVLTISGEGSMEYWSDAYAVPWHEMRSQIKSVIIESGVTDISGYAFCQCVNLTEVSLPEGLLYINGHVFENCSSLQSIVLPNSLSVIGSSAFADCSALREINIPDLTNYFGNYAFANCVGLTGEIVINGEGTVLEPYAFYGCAGITSVVLADVFVMRDRAFSHCGSLKEVAISRGISDIGRDVFGSSAVETIYFGGTKEEWNSISISEPNETLHGATVYYGASSADSADGPEWSFENGVLTISGTGDMPDYGSGDAPWYPHYAEITEVVIEEGITSIGANAFYYYANLKTVSIPASVTSIGVYAFHGCDALTAIHYDGTEDQWDAIDDREGNDVLSDVSVQYVIGGTCGESVFWELADGVLTIYGEGAMKDYDWYNPLPPWSAEESTIVEVVIKDGITRIGSKAFSGYNNLKKVTFADSVTDIGDNAFEYCDGLKSVVLPNGLKTIEESAFGLCTNLEEIIFS